MKQFIRLIIVYFLSLLVFACQDKKTQKLYTDKKNNTVLYAKNLEIYDYGEYSIITISQPWQNSSNSFSCILKNKNVKLPYNLIKKYPVINVPLQSVVLCSTTNIPFLEVLGVENTLKGFPNLNYISSPKIRQRISNGAIIDVGENERLNIEKLISLSPDLILTFGIDKNTPEMETLKQNNLKTLVLSDWLETSPLGRAEWIKLFGVLFAKKQAAKKEFDHIVSEYNMTLALLKNTTKTPTVLCGAIYQDQWYIPKSDSWAVRFIADSKGDYFWKNIKGTGSLYLSFEEVFEKAKNAKRWIVTGNFKTLSELEKSNPHYNQFEAFRNKEVYTFDSKLGATGGSIYYENAPNRPDLVLKDYIKILHPDLLSNYSFTFAHKLN